jgi:DNA-binding FadR family transcriptional regulator
VNDLFLPLNDAPAYRQIANQIEERIVARILKTGDALPSETDLARQFGVNRSTVREAIRELEIQGLLGRRRGEKRLRVTRPKHEHISDGVSRALALHDVTFSQLWEAMMAIEPAAAHYAALRRSGRQVEELNAAAQRCRRSADTPLIVAAVVDFFTVVAAASGNQVLALAQAPLNVLLATTLSRMIDRVSQAHSRIVTAQGKILAAIKLQKGELARLWMEKHIRDFKRGHELEAHPIEHKSAALDA